jgi:sugar phosphate isomerase/epimerase
MLGATATAAYAGLGARADAMAPRTKLQRIGIQLYSLRQLAAADLAGVLERLARIGYAEVETAGSYGHSAPEFRALLVKNKLTAPSAHVPVDAIEASPNEIFSDAKTIGHEWITVPSPSGRVSTIAEWKTFAVRLNRAAALAKDAGFRFAYHNHDTEFKKVEDSVPWDVLMSETDPKLVFAQIDLYHAVNGGADPLDLLARYGPRIKMLHVKDMGAADRRMVDVGAGTIDFKTIFARAKGIEHYFVENDNPADPFAFAAHSYDYLSKLEF